jgi:gamma-glutamylcyclotransferase (GGCT)/AIG2-like uncharacterized protein YtfP
MFDVSGGQLPVFVYGTLRHGQLNYHLLDGKTVSKLPASIADAALYALPEYPMLTDGTSVVRGELMTLDPHQYRSILSSLDSLEGYVPGNPIDQNTYNRLERTAQLENGSPVRAWVYLGNPVLMAEYCQKFPLVVHGDWCRYLEEKR